MALDFSNQSINAWRRENGRVGVRNHVVILPVDDISNAACEAVANNVKGTMALPHAYGRLQFGEDLDLHFRTMIGTGANPNVAAVIVIGIEPEWTKVIVDGIAKTGKPVEGFSIEQKGDFETIRHPVGRPRNSFIGRLNFKKKPAACLNFGYPRNVVKAIPQPVCRPAQLLEICMISFFHMGFMAALGKHLKSPALSIFAKSGLQILRPLLSFGKSGRRIRTMLFSRIKQMICLIANLPKEIYLVA